MTLRAILYSFMFLSSLHVAVNIKNPDSCRPLIIAHRGASGYLPENTLEAYKLAVEMGTDYIELDLVMTKDKHLIASHDNELSLTTNIVFHPEFASRRRDPSTSNVKINGWYAEDFTLEEIKTLRAIERIPHLRPESAKMSNKFQVPVFQEILDMISELEITHDRTIGIYIEIKHSNHLNALGLKIEDALVDALHSNGYKGRNASVYIQSYAIETLKYLRTICDFRLIQLIDEDHLRPRDKYRAGEPLTFGKMMTIDGLKQIATYADGVAPHKSKIMAVDENNTLDAQTSFVKDAHSVGLKVHPFTFRAENYFLSDEFKSSDPSDAALGNLEAQVKKYLDAGVDGFVTDHPDILARIRGQCTYDN